MATDPSSIKVGVLSLHESKESKAILNTLEALGYEQEWLRQDSMAFHIDETGTTIEPSVDVVINRMLLSNTDQPIEGLGLVSIYEDIVPVLNGSGAVLKAMHKMAAASTLDRFDIPLPETYMGLGYDRLNDARRYFPTKAVYKSAIGTHGGGTWLIETDKPVEPKVGNRQALLQEFVSTTGDKHHDYRVYIVGDEILGAMRRTAKPGEWRTNVAQGGAVKDATETLPDRVSEIARRSTNALGLDYAGVDIIEDGSSWYVLEVNPTAGFRGFFRATGRCPAPWIAALAIERAGGTVDYNLVMDLESTLDDSQPSCVTNRSVSAFDERPTIGYTEDVVVSGTSGSEHVIALADTGASRTSIDLGLAAMIGVGPIKQRTRVKSGLSPQPKPRPVVDLVIGIKGRWHTVTASIEDRSRMDNPVLIGRDILKNYRVGVKRPEEE